MSRKPVNLIPNGDFQVGAVGRVPEGWTFRTARPQLAPVFELVENGGRRLLMATGGGNPTCVGYVSTRAPIRLGKTYAFRVRFRIADGLDPQEHLLFQCYHESARDGIFQFRRLDDGWIEGSADIHYAGSGDAEAEVRLLYRLCADGKAWVKEASLEETKPVSPRWVTVACTQGKTDMTSSAALLDVTGEEHVDLVLLPEAMAGADVEEPVPGPASELMVAKARQYGMFVAGGIMREDAAAQRVLNTALLIDPQGDLVGMYDKLHPYSPELNEKGITPGTTVPVFDTPLGKIGFIICYDSWFTDVVELLALKGAEIVLFPNAGYYRSLMPARASDNCVRVVVSTWNNEYGVWDTVGRSVVAPDADPTCRPVVGETFKDVREKRVGEFGLLIASLDLSCSPSPARNGGTMYSAPGGKRNRREQIHYLEDEIAAERRRWWVE